MFNGINGATWSTFFPYAFVTTVLCLIVGASITFRNISVNIVRRERADAPAYVANKISELGIALVLQVVFISFTAVQAIGFPWVIGTWTYDGVSTNDAPTHTDNCHFSESYIRDHCNARSRKTRRSTTCSASAWPS